MIVPPISLPSVSSESLLYFPANVCGLEIGELFIPNTTVALIDIPEITVPDFVECPFYVVLPPPTYYASSAYPLYEWDSISLSSSCIAGDFIREPIHWDTLNVDSSYIQSNLVSGNLRDSRLSIEAHDSIFIGSSVLEISLRDAPKTSYSEGIAITSNVVSITQGVYRYLTTETSIDSINVSSNFISGSITGFRYLNANVITDSIGISSNVLSGSTQNYRYLTIPEDVFDSVSLQSILISGNIA